MREEPHTDDAACVTGVCRSGHNTPPVPRLFLCARCRKRCLICSCCDRGHIYCSGACSGHSRRERQLEAARRSRARPEARQKRTLRNQHLRERKRTETHQGLPAVPMPDTTEAPEVAETPTDNAPMASTTNHRVPRCHWCGRLCGLMVRRPFIQYRERRRVRAGHSRKEITAHGYSA